MTPRSHQGHAFTLRLSPSTSPTNPVVVIATPTESNAQRYSSRRLPAGCEVIVRKPRA
jgi:hypothetical protein